MGRITNKLNQIYNKISQGDEKGFLYYSAFLPLYLLSFLYGIGVEFRFFLYRIGLFKTGKLNCKVISIGNITVGGSGKTPMTIFLAQRLVNHGKRPVILSRGYKGNIKDIGIVSDGRNILLTPKEAGDEPYLMAAKLKNIPVIVGRDRYKAGLYAVEKFNPDVIILDDGFQHIRLVRNINILLVDGRRGFGNGYLFPLGVLREPLSGLKRASVILVKESSALGGISQKSEEKIDAALIEQVSFRYKANAIVNLANGSGMPVDVLKGKRVAALSGIADPKSFRNTLEGLGAIVAQEISYPDHHSYSSADLNDVAGLAGATDMIITTEKDAIKLKNLPIEHLPIYVLDIEVEIEDLEMFDKITGFMQ